MGHSASLRLLYLDANDYVSELAGVWGVRSLSFCLTEVNSCYYLQGVSTYRDACTNCQNSTLIQCRINLKYMPYSKLRMQIYKDLHTN